MAIQQGQLTQGPAATQSMQFPSCGCSPTTVHARPVLRKALELPGALWAVPIPRSLPAAATAVALAGAAAGAAAPLCCLAAPPVCASTNQARSMKERDAKRQPSTPPSSSQLANVVSSPKLISLSGTDLVIERRSWCRGRAREGCRCCRWGCQWWWLGFRCSCRRTYNRRRWYARHRRSVVTWREEVVLVAT